MTAKEQDEWKIPPCVSNWKNAKGYTIPLDKRLAADGRGLDDVHINDNFAKLTEAMSVLAAVVGVAGWQAGRQTGRQARAINPAGPPLAARRYIAERGSREAIELRAAIRDKAANKERERQETKLRELAQKAREVRGPPLTPFPAGCC